MALPDPPPADPDTASPTATDRPARRSRVVTAAPPPSGLKVFFDRHGNKILLGVTLALLLVVLIRFRIQSAAAATERAAANLSAARQALSDFKGRPYWQFPVEQYANDRRSIASAVEDATAGVLADSDDPKLRAEALLIRGDANWLLANQPELPGAATQPALALDRPADAYLRAAAEAYEQVVSRHADLPIAANAARASLAAVAENRGEWDAARKQYDAVLADAAAPKGIKDLATAKLKVLDQLRQPMYLSPATAPSFVPFLPPSPTTLPTNDGGAAPAATPPAPTTAPSVQ